MSRTCSIAALGVVLFTVSVGATVVIPTEFREVVADATLIVRGHLTDVRSVVVPGEGIDSIGTIAVDAVLKGQPGEFVSVRVPGGEVGRSRIIVVGAPKLTTGEHAVFFLKRGEDNTWRPIGLTMGIYRVVAEPVTGRAVVNPPVVPGHTTAATGPVVRGDPLRRPMPVGEFESLVRLIMAGQGAPQGARR